MEDYNYNSRTLARISSGEGFEGITDFDRYGRILSIMIRDGGRYYKDTPTIKAIDDTGKGKGAVLACTVKYGSIQYIEVVNPGIDYDKSNTRIVAIPVGSGAEISAEVEYYEVNRYAEIEYEPGWKFDDGNGFLYRPPFGDGKKILWIYLFTNTTQEPIR